MSIASEQPETIFKEYKSLLFSIAYHMLGSVMDAEDCVQEAFLQWYIAEQQETIANPKAYLCTLVTRRSIDRLRSAQAQRETYAGLWLPEPLVEGIDPSDLSERTETLSLAFLLLLERLSPLERAVFLLRQVFDYDYAEIAAMVGKSVENCRQVMHRARRHLPPLSSLAQLPQTRPQQVFSRFVQVCMEGDMPGLLNLLSDDVVLHADGGGKVTAARNPLYGPERVARYLLGIKEKLFYKVMLAIRPSLINGQPGLIGYLEKSLDEQFLLGLRPAERERIRRQLMPYQLPLSQGQALFVIALAYADNQLQEIDIIVNPEKLQHIPALER
jgi:RNA polymerase sigma-70 factor (ECF subfamily)